MDVIDEDHPQREAAKEVDPQITAGRGRGRCSVDQGKAPSAPDLPVIRQTKQMIARKVPTTPLRGVTEGKQCPSLEAVEPDKPFRRPRLVQQCEEG
jgi:hypothetical protein